jgi:hypothetical protein
MNAAPQQVTAKEYREAMQQAAAAFIQRHQAEHLHDDKLYSRTVSYLVNSLDVPTFMADRIAHLAMSERLPKGKPWIGVDMASGRDWTVPLQRYQVHFLSQLGNKTALAPR